MKSKVNKYCIILAVASFVGLFIEALQVLIEKNIYGVDITQFSPEQNIRHWRIIIPIWMIVSLMVIYQSKKKCQFNVFKPQSVSKKWQMICGITLPLLFVVGWSFLNGSPGFYRLYNSFPHNMFALQYTYYVFEMLLAGLIISFSQKVFDNVKKKDCRMPWGGLILGLSWGLGHYITKGNLFVALFAFVVAIFFGLIYNWLGKDLKKTWPLMFLVFVCL